MNEMTDAADVLAEVPSIATATPFYVVGTRKFILMFIFTFGVYTVYWMYRQWDQYRDSLPYGSDEARLWPFMRAMFSVFYFHSLFAKVRANAAPRLDEWEYRTHATILLILLIVERIIDKISGKDYSSWDVLGLILMAPMCYFYVKAQQLINDSCGDPKGSQNTRLTMANYGWIGAFVLIVLIIGAGPVLLR
ncbi:MAG: hypothetical protein ACJ8HI_24015 [Massilia sp.]